MNSDLLILAMHLYCLWLSNGSGYANMYYAVAGGQLP
jgi:hypothetical protein